MQLVAPDRSTVGLGDPVASAGGAEISVFTAEWEEPEWDVVARIAVGIVLVTLVLLLGYNHIFYKAFRRYEWEVAQVIAQERAAADKYLWEGKELTRLHVLFTGWRDWTKVIGEIVHRPWQPPQAQFSALEESVIDRLPAAMAAAQQEDGNADLPNAVVVSALEAVYPRGWAARAFAQAHDRFAHRLPVTRSSGFLEVDADVAGGDLGARLQLVEFWETGEAREALGQRQAQELRDMTHEGVLDVPARKVRRMGKYSDEMSQPESAYFSPIATSGTAFALDVFGPVARTSNRHYIHTVRLWLPHAALPAVRDRAGPDGGGQRESEVHVAPAEASTALRVDLSRRVRVSDLAIFGGRSPAAGSVAEAAEAVVGSGDFI